MWTRIWKNINCINSKGGWCPYCCSPPQKLCEEECQDCFQKSFASHEKSKYWSTKNNQSPRQVYKNSNKKYWFECHDCSNEFKMKPCDVVRGNWCPICKNKTEKKMLKWLNYMYDENVEYQIKYDWCKNPETNRFLPFDFVIERVKIIIELDGPQHFRQISNWQCHKKTQKMDIYKMKQAFKNGYSIIRIKQDDVWNDTNKWEKRLFKAIKKYKNPKIIFIGDGYENHQK